MDGWDGWSDGPITPASNNWTELPCVSTTTIDEAIIKEAVSVGRACLNDDNNSKKMKAAVLTPIGIPHPSSTELILLSFNKSLGVLPLSIPTIIGDSGIIARIFWLGQPRRKRDAFKTQYSRFHDSQQRSITLANNSNNSTQVHPSIGIRRGYAQNRRQL